MLAFNNNKKKFECTFCRGLLHAVSADLKSLIEKPNERKGAPEKMRRRDSTRDWSSRLWTSRGERRLIRREEALFPRLLVSPSLHESFPSSPCSSGRVQLTAQQKNTEMSSVPPCLSSSFLRSFFFLFSFFSPFTKFCKYLHTRHYTLRILKYFALHTCHFPYLEIHVDHSILPFQSVTFLEAWEAAELNIWNCRTQKEKWRIIILTRNQTYSQFERYSKFWI